MVELFGLPLNGIWAADIWAAIQTIPCRQIWAADIDIYQPRTDRNMLVFLISFQNHVIQSTGLRRLIYV